MGKIPAAFAVGIFLIGDAPKSGSARDLGNCLQSRNVPLGNYGDCERYKLEAMTNVMPVQM